MPITTTGPQARLTLTDNAASEGMLARSADGRFLTLAGYDAAVGLAYPEGTVPATVNRVVGRVSFNGALDTTTRIADNLAAPFGVVTDDGSRFWVVGADPDGGVRFVPLGGGATTSINAQVAPAYAVGIFDTQLYVTSFIGVMQVGSGRPTASGQPATTITSEFVTPSGFAFLDRSAVIPGLDTLYLNMMDLFGTTEIKKFSFDGMSWIDRGFIVSPNGAPLLGLTGASAGAEAILYATEGTGAGNRLLRLIDTAAYDAPPSGALTTLATAPANTMFRGVAFAPEAALAATATPLPPTATLPPTPTEPPTATLPPTPTATPLPTPANQTTISGPPLSGRFGTSVTTLPNGNFVVTDPDYAGGAGAVYLYNGASHSLISQLTGSPPGAETADHVGNGGVTVLANGNFVVRSPGWGTGGMRAVGAVTWINSTTGLTGSVSSANSLVGSAQDDTVGAGGVTALPNGNYVVRSSDWDNGGVTDVGAVTWGNGTTGRSGAVSSANSLVGFNMGDRLGASGVTALTNGNYVVSSSDWDNGGAADAGAVTWGNGATGGVGTVSSANSLVGFNMGDRLGSGGVAALSNGNYVVTSPEWDNGGARDAGAVTWGNGASGVAGPIVGANSLFGSAQDDKVGGGGVTALPNGNYVVTSPTWDNGGVTDVGAVTWGNGPAGLVGPISNAANLVGTTAGDQVGSGGITALTNGYYVVSSPQWDNGAAVDAGAVTWRNGTTGSAGTVSSATSLIGPTEYDRVGSHGVTVLSNGNYVVRSPEWDLGLIYNVGAVTWGNGATGLTGPVSSANSFIGAAQEDRIGTSDVIALTNGNYIVSSPEWDLGLIYDVGAVTWGNGTTGLTGPISSTNSLVGSAQDDKVGYGGVTALTNGNYIVSSTRWHDNRGAATWGNGTTGSRGPISSMNSLVGTTAGDHVGGGGPAMNFARIVTALPNGHYVVGSPEWNDGRGAVTWGNGTRGNSGIVSTTNSLVGSTTGDYMGGSGPFMNVAGAVTALPTSAYVVFSPGWDTDNRGAISVGYARRPMAGTVSDANSVLGTVGNGGDSMVSSYDAVNQQLIAGRPASNLVTIMAPLPAQERPYVSLRDSSVIEGDSGLASLVFTAALDPASASAVTVQYATQNGTASAGSDYSATSGAITFNPGETTKPITVTILGETLYEINETLSVSLASASADTGDGAIGIIANDDAPPGVAVTGGSAIEGDSGTRTLTFMATLSAVSNLTATVGYATADGTATAPSDYSATSGVITFNPGETAKPITVTIQGDRLYEANETVNVTLANASEATITTASAPGTITNDDAAVSVAISASSTVIEGDSGPASMVFTATLNRTPARVVTVDYAPQNGTATAPGDYAAQGGSLYFGPTETTKTFTITIHGDTMHEPNETLGATLSNLNGAEIISAANPLGTIIDDDAASWPPQVDIVGPPVSGRFGTLVTTLLGGNFVVTDPGYQNNTGAVYLYNGATHALISRLTGSASGHEVGSGGVTALTNGHFVVISPNWDNGGTEDVGAVTWVNGTTGLTGTVSVANSIFGSTQGDRVGGGNGGGVTGLDNGNYVVRSPDWDNGGAANAGAVTWAAGIQSFGLPVSTANSLVGSGNDNGVGAGGVTELTNGNYVVKSPYWDNGGLVDVGAVTWGSGTMGRVGTVSSANSLVGSYEFDKAGAGGVTALTNGNYVVSSPAFAYANYGRVGGLGAATWGNGATGVAGPISSDNSLTGWAGRDTVSSGGITALANGNYVVNSPRWGAPSYTNYVDDFGAVTWGNGTTGSVGTVSGSNSLVGTVTGHRVGSGVNGIGSGGVTALTNGNYVVSSPLWDYDTVENAGAATWLDGTGSFAGTISTDNSMFGLTANDRISSGGITALSNGHYVVTSPGWNNGGLSDVGAVRWGNGAFGTTGFPSWTNSLIGSTPDDQVGSAGVTALKNARGFYVVSSPQWHNGSMNNAGAATWVSDTGIAGVVSITNSLVGTSSQQSVSSGGVTALNNGNYVVNSPEWDAGSVADVGAATWGNGTTGIFGAVSRANSLVGSRSGDGLDQAVAALANGHYAVKNAAWDNGGLSNAGAIAWGNGTAGITGTFASVNSVLGTAGNSGSRMGVTYDSVNQQVLVGRPDSNLVTVWGPLPAPPQPRVALADGSVVEGGNGMVRALVFTATLSPPSAIPAAVDYATQGGTATAGSDYTAASGTITFAAGQTTKTITVTVLGDGTAEPDETVQVALSNVQQATIATATATGTIIDDDDGSGLPVFSIVGDHQPEGASMAFTVTLSPASDGTATVQYSTTHGSATGNDYLSRTGTLTFTAGMTQQVVRVATIQDSTYEADETFGMLLTHPSGATTWWLDHATSTIRNDDASPSVSVAGGSVIEGDSGTATLLFPVTLSAASEVTATVAYATQDGTAILGSDYTATSGTITFTVGITRVVVPVAVHGDTQAESDETLTLTLTTPTDATLGTASASGTIRNDDPADPTATPMTPTPTATPGTPTATPGTPTATPGTPTATPGTPTATPGTPTATPGTPTATVPVRRYSYYFPMLFAQHRDQPHGW